MTYTITPEKIYLFLQLLREEERSAGTIENYQRHIKAFAAWAGEADVTRELAAKWKAHLLSRGYAPGTVNTILVPLNRFFSFLGWHGCRVKSLRIQRRMFRENRRELTRSEYARLLSAARSQGRERLALLMESICATGIRVSEVEHLTVEAVRVGRAEISLKGKIRTILIPSRLRKKLLQFAHKEKTASGAIFRTKSGRPISRKQIWAEMKSLCRSAGVMATKVFPHNLRHLFARTFYRAERDLARLADILGHASVDTTRIYTLETGSTWRRKLDKLNLLL